MAEKTKKFTYNAKEIPTNSGCYLFFGGKKDELLYIGKAKNLRQRVSSYFNQNKKGLKTKHLVSKINRIEIREVSTEIEALILENNLIKKHQPKYNILLRDDKTFLYLRITKESEPKMEITRRLVRDGSTYIGPKTSAKSFRSTINFCQKFFGVRMVNPSQDNYVVKQQTQEISQENYRKNVQRMIKFLHGDIKEAVQNLTELMQEQAKNSNFEAAARTRDLLISIQGNNEKQLVESSDLTARDFINFSREKNEIIVVRLVFRHGKFIDQNELSMKAEEFFSAEEILEKFCWEFYRQVDQLPQEIILPLELPNITQIFQLISTENKQEKLVKIVIPQKGDKIKLLNLAKKNAENSLQKSIIKKTSHQKVFKMASQELQKSLQKEDPLQTIECYDISHFSGQETVASQVVFVDGQPHNSAYRRYKIKSLQAGEIDDFKSMAETLTRRMDKLQQDFFVWEKEQEKISQENSKKEQKEKEEEIIENNKESKPKKDKKDKPKKTTPPEKFPLPDLIVLDGGKGQLSAVLQVLKKLLSKDFPFNIEQQIIALAKEQEEVFQGKFEKNEIKFTKLDIPASSSASMLLQRLRDEAHRFAHSYNQNLRKKQAEKSILDEIDGIGGITKKKLLKAFGSPREISQQNDKQLLTILNKKQLENLRKIL